MYSCGCLYVSSSMVVSFLDIPLTYWLCLWYLSACAMLVFSACVYEHCFQDSHFSSWFVYIRGLLLFLTAIATRNRAPFPACYRCAFCCLLPETTLHVRAGIITATHDSFIHAPTMVVFLTPTYVRTGTPAFMHFFCFIRYGSCWSTAILLVALGTDATYGTCGWVDCFSVLLQIGAKVCLQGFSCSAFQARVVEIERLLLRLQRECL